MNSLEVVAQLRKMVSVKESFSRDELLSILKILEKKIKYEKEAKLLHFEKQAILLKLEIEEDEKNANE